MNLTQMVDQTIKQYKEESDIAAKLLNPPPAESFKKPYLVTLEERRYILIASEGAYYADLQRRVELCEGRTFDELGLPYLDSSNTKVLPKNYQISADELITFIGGFLPKDETNNS